MAKRSAKKSPADLSRKISSKGVFRLVIVGLFVYIILAGLTGLQHSIAAITSARPLYIGLAIAVILCSYGCAALTVKLLARGRMPYRPLLWISLAGGLVNRLLPGGLGGIGLNAWYLKKHGHTLAEASAVMAANNVLGFLGNILLVILVLLAEPVRLPRLRLPEFGGLAVVVAGVVITLLGIALLCRLRPGLPATGIGQIRNYLSILISRPGRTAAAVLSSIVLTALHATGLLLVAHSLHLPVSFAEALLAISFGAFTGALIPTPGGLGGAEAGIAACLIAVSIVPSGATAAAVIYRGITYWLFLLPGYGALKVAEKRYL